MAFGLCKNNYARFISTIVFLIGAACTDIAPAQAASMEPQTAVRTIFGGLLARLAAEKDSLTEDKVRSIFKAQLSPHIDYVTIARWILRKHWIASNEEQQGNFLRAFENYLINTYALVLAQGKQIELSVDDNVQTKNRVAIVRAEFIFSGTDLVPINLRLIELDDEWKLFDVSFSGVSLAKTFRADFNYIARDGGIDAITKVLRAKGHSDVKDLGVANLPANN